MLVFHWMEVMEIEAAAAVATVIFLQNDFEEIILKRLHFKENTVTVLSVCV